MRDSIISVLFPTHYLYEEKIYHHPHPRSRRSRQCCLSQLKGLPTPPSSRMSHCLKWLRYQCNYFLYQCYRASRHDDFWHSVSVSRDDCLPYHYPSYSLGSENRNQ